jgi:signal transduction histidine kinase/ligand-binding sensor domain-containing protein/ActR/RegA family two-component response regulator
MGRSVFCQLALVLTTLSCVNAAGPRYSFRHYGVEDGLGNATVLSLYQDRSGFLWVGTEAGLYRYEGSRFRLMGEPDGMACLAETRGMVESADGALWVAACNRLYRRSSSGRFELATQENVIVNSLSGIAPDPEGGVLVGTVRGLMQASRAGVRPYPATEGFPMKETRAVYREGSRLWFGCDLALCSLEGGVITRYGKDEGLPETHWDSILRTPSGVLWVRSQDSTYFRPPGQTRFRPLNRLAPSFSSGYLALTRDGSLLIPTNAGLAIVRGADVQTVSDNQGLRTALTGVALEDRQGSLWIGLLGEGLARWQGRGEWELYTKENGLPSNIVWQIIRARSDKALWVATALGVVKYPAKGSPRVWGWAQQVNGAVRWLREAPDGGIWLAAQERDLERIDPASGDVRKFGPENGLPADRIFRGVFDDHGRLWLATRAGVYFSENPDINAHFAPVPGGPKTAWDVAEDHSGAILTTTSQGLWRYSGGRWRRYAKADGLLSDAPYIVQVASDGALWLRHRFDGIVERVLFDGERLASVTAIKPEGVPVELTALHGFDSLGRYWQGTPSGVSVLSGSLWRNFTVEDGMVSNDCDGEAFWADPDGSVWIGTSGGLAHYSPREGAWQPPAPPDPPVITSIEISQRLREARFEFSLLDFQREARAQFAYSIDEGPWIEARERAVTVAALPPGDHQLRVRAKTWGQPWSNAFASTPFRFDPFWYETWWAILGLYLAAVLALLGAARLWMFVQRRRAAERAKILEEKARAEASSQAKSQFLAHMSHEIRTPIHQIMGLTEDLAAVGLPPAGREILMQLRASGSGLFELLNGILDLSKLEAGKLRLDATTIDLPHAIEETIAIFARTAQTKGIDLHLDCLRVPDCVVADGRRLRQILFCLLSNAVKFTRQGSVRVRAETISSGGGWSTVHFEVADTGPGIPPDRLARVFEPFTQGDESRNREHGGAGLGLPIASSLVKLMGGELTVESHPGQGSVFGFSLAFETTVRAARAGAAGLRILIAEDNRVNQKIMLRLLERIGCRADLAKDGAEAVEAVRHREYDVILMDIQMPNVDGLDAARQIRKLLRGRYQPRIYAVTAHAETQDRERCLEAGMDGYLTKPVSQDQLVRLLAEVVMAG